MAVVFGSPTDHVTTRILHRVFSYRGNMDKDLLPLVTERLTLRLFTGEDLDAVFAYQRLDDVARYLYRPPRTRQQCADMIAQAASGSEWHTDGDCLMLAVCRRGGPLVGEVVLRLASAAAQQVEIGWVLHPRYEGQGYATEAARALAALAFDRLGAHRLFARLDVENEASVRLCERLGMRREAHLIENDMHPDSRWGSEYIYAALRHELKR